MLYYIEKLTDRVLTCRLNGKRDCTIPKECRIEALGASDYDHCGFRDFGSIKVDKNHPMPGIVTMNASILVKEKRDGY